MFEAIVVPVMFVGISVLVVAWIAYLTVLLIPVLIGLITARMPAWLVPSKRYEQAMRRAHYLAWRLNATMTKRYGKTGGVVQENPEDGYNIAWKRFWDLTHLSSHYSHRAYKWRNLGL